MWRRARRRRQGRLGEQRAPDEQVEQATDRDRGDHGRQSAGDPARGPRQHAQRPEHQDRQGVAGDRLTNSAMRASIDPTGLVRASPRSPSSRSGHHRSATRTRLP